MGDKPERPRPPPNRRRDKAQLSCNPCRQRKLRCDRETPCGACSKRGLIDACKYATTSVSASTSSVKRPVAPRPSANLHGRIAELEGLVMALMNGQTSQTLNAPISPGQSPQDHGTNAKVRKNKKPQPEVAPQADPGTLNLRDSGTSYVQSVHWEAVLTKIRGLKDDMVIVDTKAPRGSHLFYGPNRHATRDEVLAAVPPRQVVDRLMALHFDSYIVTPYILHGKKFLREYESFWNDPSATPIAWIGLMFSMLCISVQLQALTIDWTNKEAESLKEEYNAMKDAFREKAVQCLVLARYTTGGPYILETLITVLTGEFILSKDSGRDGWLFTSMILQLAMRMGYHRDPDHFPGISPFEGEMRRRIWTTILQLDLSLSLEMGLPRSATDTHIDTKQPRNLLDSDFDEDTSEMPSPRPETEWTPMLPLICRARLISVLGLICDANTNTRPPSYKEVVKVDELLGDIHKQAIPPVLRWETLPHPITDSPSLVVQRVSVETTYYKSRILLYRGGLINRRSQQEWDWKASVKICLDSALKILSFQQMLHDESQPFGRLNQLRWKITHIFNQDVLLATSVLCLYLQDVDKFEGPGKENPPRAEVIRERLIVSHKIWSQMSTASAEAGKVAKALNIVLGDTDDASAVNHDNGSDLAASSSYDLLADFDVMPLMSEYGGNSSNEYFPSGLYSPLTFFDNLLEGR